MSIEGELRGALDVPAPPVKTTLDDVLRRGRRRVFAQRAGAVLGVVVVVAGVGFGAATLNAAGPTEPATPPSSLTTLPPRPLEEPLDWKRVDVPPQTPLHTFQPGNTAPPPDGRKILDLPFCDMSFRQEGLNMQVGIVELPQAFLDKAREGVRRDAGKAVGPLQAAARHYEFDVSDERGTGSIRITAGKFRTTPRVAADDGVWETGDCLPPYRHVLEDGSIVQVHSVHGYEPFQSLTQRMAIYRADGTLIQFELHNFGSPDMTPDPKQPRNLVRTGPGRETLPLTDRQFALLGATVAAGS